jgi:hypothetical protein
MKTKQTLCIFTFFILIAFQINTASAAEMTINQLQGKWAIGTVEQDCSDSSAEFFMFENDGTFKSTRNTTVEAAGFYKVDKGFVYLNFISSIGFFSDISAVLEGYKDTYTPFSVTLLPFNVSEDRFEAFGLLENQINKGIAVKCI